MLKVKKLRDLFRSIRIRCHYIDLTIDTIREKILRIKTTVTDGMLKSYALPK